MLSFLKDHPFAVEAFFESSTVFAFAVPKDEAARLIPECLTVDTFKDKWAFVAVAMVQTRNLRPKDFPKFLGSDFFLIGYRVFVRYTDSNGKPMRGLYILKSETNSKRMEVSGNVFTHYNYSTTDISEKIVSDVVTISSMHSDFHATFSEADENIPLPDGSPFVDWKEARKYEGPLPFTFTYESATNKVVIIEGVRQNWKPIPLKVVNQHFSFVDSLGFSEKYLANAFRIKNVPYHWKRGRIDHWSGSK